MASVCSFWTYNVHNCNAEFEGGKILWSESLTSHGFVFIVEQLQTTPHEVVTTNICDNRE